MTTTSWLAATPFAAVVLLGCVACSGRSGSAPPAADVTTSPTTSTATSDPALTAWSASWLAVGPDGLYGTDSSQARVFLFTRDATPSTVVGAGAGGLTNGFAGDGGPASEAHLNYPKGIAIDDAGLLYVVDTEDNRIRRVDADGTITTVVGTGKRGFSGNGGPAVAASLNTPTCIAFHDGAMYFCDRENAVVRKVDATGVITTVAGTGQAGFSGDGGPAARAQLDQPEGLAWDDRGNMYIAEAANCRVRVVDRDGIIETFVGTGHAGYSGDGGPATQARINDPNGLAFDAAGNLYVATPDSGAVRVVTPAGVISTLPGTGHSTGHSGSSVVGPISPTDLVLAADGTLYIADPNARRILALRPHAHLTTFASIS